MNEPPSTPQRLDYDRLAADYAQHRRVHPGVIARLIDSGRISAASRVLEVGCGSGNYLLALRDLTGCTAWGLDPSIEMLARARARPGAESATWLEGRADSLPFPDASLDLIFSVNVIHHIQDRPAYFREARRVLVPGGQIATATDSAENIARRRPLSSHWPETIAVELARYPAIDLLQAEMTAAGFNHIHRQHVELTYDLHDADAYRARAFSSLHLISEDAFTRGLTRLATDLAAGPVSCRSLYTLLWGHAPER